MHIVSFCGSTVVSLNTCDSAMRYCKLWSIFIMSSLYFTVVRLLCRIWATVGWARVIVPWVIVRCGQSQLCHPFRLLSVYFWNIVSLPVTASWNPYGVIQGVYFAILVTPFLERRREACLEFTLDGYGKGMKLMISRYMYRNISSASDVLGHSVLGGNASITGQVDLPPVTDRYRVMITLQYSEISVDLVSVGLTYTQCTSRGRFW